MFGSPGRWPSRVVVFVTSLRPMCYFGGLVCAVGMCGGRATAAFLPAQLVPSAPFPLVLTQSLEREFVAPGVERATYRLQTSAGPLVISLVTADPRERSVRLGTVLAHDRIVSAGETISSMAARTGAVAGINADYFDIGNTNTPLGMLAQNGALVRSPAGRAALTVARDRSVGFATFRFRGTASANGATAIPLTTVNEWPPHDGAALLTPAYGIAAAIANCVIAELTPQPNTDPAAVSPGGRYRVTQIDTGTAPAQPGYALGLGPAAQGGLGTLPDVGDIIDVTVATDPPLTDLLQAVGGGPALLEDRVPIDDPLSPGYSERARRIPAAAAGRFGDGELAFVVVDGRRPAVSIGVNRAELIALLAGLGATDAIQFDSGGSATLVARILGETGATVQNEPSDGVERPVADGLFVYSDAPLGPPARLVVRPSTIEALPDVAIGLRAAVVDAAGHFLGAAGGPWHVDGDGARIDEADVLHVGGQPLATTLRLARNGVRADLPLEIVPSVNRIVIVPERPNPDPGATVLLRAQAFDAQGRGIDTGDRVGWSALRGTIARTGAFTAGPADGFVTASVGDARSSKIVRVGRHRAPLAGFDPAGQALWRFTTIPAGAPGMLSFTPQSTLQLTYDFTQNERAAYAGAAIAIGEPLSISCAIDGDGKGAGVRVALLDRYGERAALTLAKTVDFIGLQRRTVRVPPALAPPIVLQSFYVVGSLGAAPVKPAGTIGIRACELVLPGSASPTP